MSAFRRKLDKQRPHAVVYGAFHGATWEQGGRYFNAAGEEIEIPGHAVVAEPPSPVDQGRRIAEIMEADRTLSITDAAAKVQAEVEAYNAEYQAWQTGKGEKAPAAVRPQRAAPPPAAPAPAPPPSMLGFDPATANTEPDESGAPPAKREAPLDSEGRPPWEWSWNDMLKHCTAIGLDRPKNDPAGRIALKEFYGVAA